MIVIAPNAVAGVLTGVGFIGGGLVFRSGQGTVRGITSAAALFACTAIGLVAGTGRLLLALFVTGLVLVLLEIPSIPLLKYLDGRRYRAPPDDEAPGA